MDETGNSFHLQQTDINLSVHRQQAQQNENRLPTKQEACIKLDSAQTHIIYSKLKLSYQALFSPQFTQNQLLNVALEHNKRSRFSVLFDTKKGMFLAIWSRFKFNIAG